MTIPFVVPDTEAPSGGTLYDLRLTRAGAHDGRGTGNENGNRTGDGRRAGLETIPVPGAWPNPNRRERTALARVLGRLPAGGRVLVDGLVACGVPEVIVAATRRSRVVVLVHLPLADETGLGSATAAELNTREREVLRSCSAVVATSRWAARRLRALHGLDRVAVVPPGVDPAPLARGSGFQTLPEAVPRLLCVASLTPRKGHDVLFEALRGMDDLAWECVCVGPGTPDPNAGERVRFTGPLTGAALATAYHRADLSVLASRAETYGMVVTEALARGLPVVATDVGGVPEALGRASDASVPGSLVPPGEPEALATALRTWLTDPATRERTRASARLRREDLTGWGETARSMARVLDLV